MRILSIPLDERPFNDDYARQIAASIEGVEFIQPPAASLGSKKQAADIDRLWKFVFETFPYCDTAIISAEMMLYGGLLPSRIHHHPAEELIRIADRFKELRKLNPTARILVFSLILRIPGYDSDEEEPGYHAVWGKKLWRYSQLLASVAMRPEEPTVASELQALEQDIPAEIRREFLNRRQVNHEVTNHLLTLFHEKAFDDFLIPQDDNSPLGLQVLEREDLLRRAEQLDLPVDTYPGADEVGCTLLSRVICDEMSHRPRIGLIWSNSTGPDLIPSYEGQKYRTTVLQHIASAGMTMVETGRDTKADPDIDMFLALNVPPVATQESSEQGFPFTASADLIAFVDTIGQKIADGIPVVVADVAYANGSDIAMIQLLKERNLLSKLAGYSAINTNGNTLGTSLAIGCAYLSGADTSDLTLYRLIDDCCYQAVVRKLTGAVYPYAWHEADDATIHMVNTLLPKAIAYFIGDIPYSVHCELPWNRLFECKIEFAKHCEAVSEMKERGMVPLPAKKNSVHTESELAEDLTTLGILGDSTILIHSSCKSIGPVDGGADTVLDVFQRHFADGLLVFPTHTWDRVNPENPTFVMTETSCCTGILPELFRKRPGVVRSGHPTHSVAAYGKSAVRFTADDIYCDTPCARGSSWGKLIEQDAVILLLGVTFTRNTFIHGIEEWLDIPGRLTDGHTMYYTVLPDGRRIEVPSRRHIGHPSEQFDRVLPDCIALGIVHQGFFGDAPILWFKARELATEIAWRLFLEPHLFDDDTSLS